MASQLASIIPGFSALTADSSNLIKQLMSGQLTGGERRAIYDAGAERGVAGGMPGSTGIAGSLFANADLRNIGVASGQRQQQGFQDLLAMLQGYSGTVAPTAGQEIQQNQFNWDANFRQRQYEDAKNKAEADRIRASNAADRKKLNFRNYATSPQWSTPFTIRDSYMGAYDFPSNVNIRPGIAG